MPKWRKELLGRADGAEAGHADEAAIRSDPALPAKAQRRFDAEARRRRRGPGVPVAFVLQGESFPARHRDHRCRHALGLQRSHGPLPPDATSEPVAINVARRGPDGFGKHVTAAGGTVLARHYLAERQGSAATGPARSARLRGAAPVPSIPPFPSRRRGGTHGGRGCPQRRPGASTGWWVGPSSPRPMLSWVSTWITRWSHQRRQAQRGAQVVGEDQEGAGIGDDAAMQRHAVHGGRHAMLAHAPVDEAAGVSSRA